MSWCMWSFAISKERMDSTPYNVLLCTMYAAYAASSEQLTDHLVGSGLLIPVVDQQKEEKRCASNLRDAPMSLTDHLQNDHHPHHHYWGCVAGRTAVTTHQATVAMPPFCESHGDIQNIQNSQDHTIPFSGSASRRSNFTWLPIGKAPCHICADPNSAYLLCPMHGPATQPRWAVLLVIVSPRILSIFRFATTRLKKINSNSSAAGQKN